MPKSIADEPSRPPCRPGRPCLFGPADVVRVGRALAAEGVAELTVAEFVREVMARVGCSRRTAYRALHRACDAGAVHLPGF